MYMHNLSPFAIQFSETFGIRWYGLAYLAGFISGYLIVDWMIRRGRIQFPQEKLADLVTWVAIGTLVGGRIGYCLFYSPDLLTEWTSDFPFWGVLKVHKGGMASHGGIAGIMVAIYLFSRKYKLSYWQVNDLAVFGGSLGIFFGRIANFINGELYGRQAPSHLSWAVQFPQEMYNWGTGQLDQIQRLAEAAQALGTIQVGGRSLTLSVPQWTEWVQLFRVDPQARANVESVMEQLIVAVQHGNVAVQTALAPVLTPRYPSQLIQALLEGLLLFIVMVIVWWRPRKPGVICGWFGVVYALARIVGEQYRMPDAQIGFQALGLTRGQWLSLAMLAVAVGVLVWRSVRKASRVGGFYPEKTA